MNYSPQKFNSNIDFNRSFDDFDSRPVNDLIQVERNGYVFQISKNPSSRVRYKGKKKQTIAYRYSLGMHMIAGHGNIDALEKIRVGEKVVWQHSDLLRDSYTSGENNQFGSIYDKEWVAQTFITTSTYIIGSVRLKLIRVGDIDETVNICIRATSGSLPTGVSLCSGTIATLNITDVTGGDWYEIFLGSGAPLISGTKYAIVMSVPDGTDIKSVDWRIEYGPGNYSSGNLCTSGDSGSTWQVHPYGSPDCMFETYERGGTSPNHTIYINKPNIFGGDKKEGGIQGNVDIMFGYPSQVQNPYLVSQLDSDIPAFRGIWSAVLNQVYIGTSPYLKPWSFFLKRVATQISGDGQWYEEKAVIRPGEEAGDDLNAVHIIRECLIDKEWGLGFNATNDINDDVWKEAADILYDEGFGLSMLWDQVIPVEDFINDILGCIAGILYQDLTTGRWILTLTRDTSAGGDLETFNEDDIIDLDEFMRPSYGEIVDQVTVQFWDKLAHKSRSCEARDIALIEKQGGVVIEKIFNYHGICNVGLANNVAERELKLVTSMLAGMRLRCTRKMSHLKPNDTFKISWAGLGITEMVIRVLTVNYGNLDKNEIYLTCIEDAFSTAATIYGDAPDTLWTDSINDPIDVINRRIIEIPYWSLCNHVIGSFSLVADLDNDSCFISTIAGKPTDDAFDYDISARLSASYDFEDIGEGNNAFTPTGVLTNVLLMDAEDVTIDLSSESDLDSVEDNTYAIINDEIVKVLSVDTTNNQVTIARGILDTVPKTHAADDIIYFMGINYGEVDVEYTNGNAPAVKLLPRTPNGSLAESDATIETKSPALASRMIRPYPPGNLKFNSESFPTYFSSGANGNKITISWNHRDRTSQVQLNSLVEHSDSGISLESGATYTIKLYDANNVLRQTISGLSGTSYELTEANEITWCGSLQSQLRFVIYTVRDSYNSWGDGYDITLKRSLRGSVAANSGLIGWIVTDMDGRKTIVASEGVSGFLNMDCNFAGSINSMLLISGVATNQNQLIGSSDISSGGSAVMAVEPDPSDLTESYTSGMDNFGGSAYWSGPTDRWLAQTFQASESYNIAKTILEMYRSGNIPGNVTLAIRAVDGSNKPTGADLCFATMDGSDITTDSGGELVRWDYSIPASLINGTTYAIVLKSPVNSDANIRWHLDESAGGYGNGNMLYSSDGGSSWTSSTGADLYFKNYK